MGYGDDLMITGEVKKLKKIHSGAKFVIGNGTKYWWSEVFSGNKSIIRGDQVKDFQKVIRLNNYPGHRPYRIYDSLNHKEKYIWNTDYKVEKGEIFFSKKELENSDKIFKDIKNKFGSKKKIVHIEPNVKISKGYINRGWGFEKWQYVVNELKNKILFISTSFNDQKILNNVLNIKNTSFRTACSIMSKTHLFVGAHGGLSHAAAALNLKAVVIFGGFIDPKILGYKIHKNIYINNKLSPCGSKYECDHCKKCMNDIKINNVIYEIKKILNL